MYIAAGGHTNDNYRTIILSYAPIGIVGGANHLHLDAYIGCIISISIGQPQKHCPIVIA